LQKVRYAIFGGESARRKTDLHSIGMALAGTNIARGHSIACALAEAESGRAFAGFFEGLHLKLGCDVHAIADRAGHRTVIGVEAVDALRRLAFVLCHTQMVGDVDPPHHQHVTLGFYLADCLGGQIALTGRNSARFQRAPKGAGQSAGCGANQIIKRRCMGFVNVRTYPVMLGDFGVHSEQNRFGLRR